MRGDKGVMATCHPKRRHVSLGYCTSCYQKLYNYDREKLGHNRTMAFLDLPVIERESLERVKTNPWANLESVVKV